MAIDFTQVALNKIRSVAQQLGKRVQDFTTQYPTPASFVQSKIPQAPTISLQNIQQMEKKMQDFTTQYPTPAVQQSFPKITLTGTGALQIGIPQELFKQYIYNPQENKILPQLLFRIGEGLNLKTPQGQKEYVKRWLDVGTTGMLGGGSRVNIRGKVKSPQATKGGKIIKPVQTGQTTQVGQQVVEPIKGEGGIEPLPWETPEYLKANPPKPTVSELATDIATQQRATIIGGGIGKPLESVRKMFADWVNARRARFVEGILKSKEFTDLDSKGINGILEFQAGDKTGIFAKVKNYFDTKREEVIKSGIDINYKWDYLPQLWSNTLEEVEKVFGTTLSKRPSFSLESVIKDYQTGINAGLIPRYQNISQLVSWYESTANKAIADANFFKQLLVDGLISSAGKAPRDWVTLSPDRFPKLRIKTAEGTYGGTYKAPAELARMINNYLEAPHWKILQMVADFASNAKNRMLSFGFPFTAINMHGVNILFRNIVASLQRGDIGQLINGFKYMLHPESAAKFLMEDLKDAPFAIKSGLTMSTSEYNSLFDSVPKTIIGKFGQTWNNLFEKPLFDKMIPALKLQNFKGIFEGYKKSGMNEYEAARAAAKFTNDVFSGINWAEVGRSKDFQNLARSLILAPDWLESNINLAIKIPQAFTTQLGNKAFQAYRRFATSFLSIYLGMDLLNKQLSGHWMHENDPGHTFELELGYTPDGQKRYLRPMGTAADWIRLPVDVAIGLAKGDFSVPARIIRNRLSTIAGSVFGLATDVNYAGQAVGVSGRDKYGRVMTPAQRMAGIGGQLAGIVGFPQFLQQGLNLATGQTGKEQALLQGLELPFRYSGGYFSGSDKQIADILGVTGKERYDLGSILKQQAPFSKNQVEAIKLGGNFMLNKIINARAVNKTEEEAKKQIENNQGGSQVVGDGKYAYWDNTSQTAKILDLSQVTSMPSSSDYQKQLKEKKAFSLVDDILNLSQDQQLNALHALGITPDDAGYYQIAKQSNDLKTTYINDELGRIGATTNDRGQLINYLVSQRKEVNGEQILTNGVIDNLFDDGLITKSEQRMLKNLTIKGGKVKTKLTGRGRTATLKRVSPYKTKPMKAPNIKSMGKLLSKNIKLKVRKYKFRSKL
jgi:hypothetical protein